MRPRRRLQRAIAQCALALVCSITSVMGAAGAPSLPRARAASADGDWELLSPSGTAPSPRRRHTAIYDPIRERMIIFGGYIGGLDGINETWALNLSGAPSWTQLAPSGVPPGRWGHTAIYDAVRDRMVIFGGASNGLRNDTWALSLGSNPTWTQLQPLGVPPAGRNRHAAIYDPIGDRMIVYGGTMSNETWELTFEGAGVWNLLQPSGDPTTRSRLRAIYDPLRDRMLTFGGLAYLGEDPFYVNRTDALSLSGSLAWTPVSTPGTRPGARGLHVLLYDTVRDRMVLQGGDGAIEYNDVWVLPLIPEAPWVQLAPGGPLPAGRFEHAGVYDSPRDRIVIFGGTGDGNVVFGDVWALSWSQATEVPGHPTSAMASYLQNSPNPFTGSTVVRFSVPQPGRAVVRIYDISGRLVATPLERIVPSGPQEVSWTGESSRGARLGSGIYFAELEMGGVRATTRMTLLR